MTFPRSHGLGVRSLVGSHVLCVFVSWAGEGGAWTGGGAVVEGSGELIPKRQTATVCGAVCPPAYLLGVSELGWPRKGNSSLTLPVSAAASFLPYCSPHTQGQAS